MLKFRHVLLPLLLAACSAHAEDTLSVTVLDQARHGSRASLLVRIHNEAAVDPDDLSSLGSPPPQACLDGGAMLPVNGDIGGCFTLEVAENDAKVAGLRSRILFSSADNSYVLLAYDSNLPGQALTYARIAVRYNGFYNGRDANEAHEISWQDGTLDARHPLRRVFALRDGLLNTEYRAILESLQHDGTHAVSLRDEERRWLKMTDRNCGEQAPEDPTWEEGFLRCRLRFIEVRLAQIAPLAKQTPVGLAD